MSWHIEHVEATTGAQLTITVFADTVEEALNIARDEIQWREYDDGDDEIPEDATWNVVAVLEERPSGQRYEAPTPTPTPRPGAPRAPDAPVDDNGKRWNELLEREGLGASGFDADRYDPDRELETRLHQTEAARAFETTTRIEEGLGTIGVLPLEAIGVDEDRARGRRRPPRPTAPVRIRRRGGDLVAYDDIGSNTEVIAGWFDREGRLAEYRLALGRGRGTPERAKTREELAVQVARLRSMKATTSAIAEVLGCGRDVVSRLASRAS